MTWREEVIVRVLLLVARMFADDPKLSMEIRALSNHIIVNAPKAAA